MIYIYKLLNIYDTRIYIQISKLAHGSVWHRSIPKYCQMKELLFFTTDFSKVK